MCRLAGLRVPRYGHGWRLASFHTVMRQLGVWGRRLARICIDSIIPQGLLSVGAVPLTRAPGDVCYSGVCYSEASSQLVTEFAAIIPCLSIS